MGRAIFLFFRLVGSDIPFHGFLVVLFVTRDLVDTPVIVQGRAVLSIIISIVSSSTCSSTEVTIIANTTHQRSFGTYRSMRVHVSLQILHNLQCRQLPD